MADGWRPVHKERPPIIRHSFNDQKFAAMNYRLSISILFSLVLAFQGIGQGLEMKTKQKIIDINTIHKHESISRNGKQILVRVTRSKDSVIQMCIHQFYDGELLLGEHVFIEGSKTILSVPEKHYACSTFYSKAGELEYIIFEKDSAFIEMFKFEKGGFVPAEEAVLKDALEIINGDWNKIFKANSK